MFEHSVYSKMPNRKKALLNKSFMTSLKEELIRLSIEDDKKNGYEYIDYSNATYEDFYMYLDVSSVFFRALQSTCKKHNVYKAIYGYYERLEWYDSDCFIHDILYRLVELGIVDEKKSSSPISKFSEFDSFYDNDEDCIKYNLIHHYKGYDVIESDYWYRDSKEELEEIYKSHIDKGKVTLVWIEKEA